MRAHAYVLFGVLLVAGMSATADAQTWNEDFNGSSVNTADWNFETGTAPNHELEWYQSNNATVANGILTIQARRQAVGGMQYTSSRMNTQGKHQFQYGHVEARIQGPLGQGYWPAFWMLGANIGSVGWPSCGEIDIMETVNATNTEFGTIHWGNPGATHVQTGFNRGMNFPAWETFAIDWTASSITWLLNGQSFGSANIANNINGTEEFHQPFFIIVNFAVGGDWPGSPNAGTVFPANLNVDYVHVSPVGGGGPTATATRTPSGSTPTPTSAPGGGIGTIVNKNSGKCVDAAAAGTANGTVVQQFACNGTGAQQWTRVATSGGYVRVGASSNANQVWDIAGVSTVDGGKIQLWAYGGGNNQQWLPVDEGGGFVHLVARSTGKCLDVPAASTADGVQLQQWACNGTAAQSFKLN
jgi:beta-glucanase (GH16 family)